MIFVIIAGAGFGEETFWRGFLFERLGKLFGSSAAAKAVIVLITSVAFGLAHYMDQRVPGVQQATIFGLTFGAIYAVWGRLFMLMIAHAA
ncbi:MAG: CPBP family intramembrane glutamic endopeptidase [Vicinamibacterales bacterium]